LLRFAFWVTCVVSPAIRADEQKPRPAGLLHWVCGVCLGRHAAEQTHATQARQHRRGGGVNVTGALRRLLQGAMYFFTSGLFCGGSNSLKTKGGSMRFLTQSSALGLLVLGLAAAPPALAALVEVNLYGTATTGGTITGQSFTGQSVRVSFSYDTNTAGVGGVFSGGVNFLNPSLFLNGTRYVNFTDELAPLHPTTVTLVNGTPDTLAVDFDMDGYVGITNRTESLTLNFAGASDFLSSVAALPASANVLGTGTGSFSLLYADDCQNYACGPGGIFFAGANFTIDRLQIGVSAVPEPSPLALLALGGLGMAAVLRRRMRG
jgi:hypothetical protein